MDTIRVSCENCEKKDSCKVDIGRGCRFCVPSNIDTTEGTTVKVCEGAQKLHITDWLKDYPNVETSEIVERVIDKEGKLVQSISDDFGKVSKEMEQLSNVSDKNIRMLEQIEENIKEENNVLKNFDEKIENISILSNKLKIS